jgi:hypothetical protein
MAALATGDPSVAQAQLPHYGFVKRTLLMTTPAPITEAKRSEHKFRMRKDDSLWNRAIFEASWWLPKASISRVPQSVSTSSGKGDVEDYS